MIQVAGGFEFQGLYVYPATVTPSASSAPPPEPEIFNYLPLAPQPETDTQGRPTLTSIPFGKGGFLQLGTQWGAQEETLKALAGELATRQGVDANLVQVRMATVEMTSATLQIGNGSGTWVEVSRSDTSGFPPYTALFHVQTTEEQQAAVMAALNGRTGFLRVIYNSALAVPVQASACIRGDARSLLAEFFAAPENIDRTAKLRSLLEEAIKQGKLTLEVEKKENTPKDLSQKAIEQAKARLIETLLRVRAEDLPDQAAVKASVELEDSIKQPLEVVTDVANWFAGKGAEHIILPPGVGGPSH
jgi:hypothetical protein